jgi:hypothetical protein
MYQDFRIVRVQTLKEAYLNQSDFYRKENGTTFVKDTTFVRDCTGSSLSNKNASLEVGGSGLRLADVKFFPTELSVEEMEATFVKGLKSTILIDGLVGNAHRW